MRLSRALLVLCTIVVFVPIYLWQVDGVSLFPGESGRPVEQFDPNSERPPFNSLDTKDFERGIIAGGETSTKTVDPIELLARTDAVEMLRDCLLKYEVAQSYTCTLCKQERINGKLNPPEVIEAGQVICEIGIAPVRPAEFVIFRIYQNTAEAQA